MLLFLALRVHSLAAPRCLAVQRLYDSYSEVKQKLLFLFISVISVGWLIFDASEDE
jgi:hypothetical protein